MPPSLSWLPCPSPTVHRQPLPQTIITLTLLPAFVQASSAAVHHLAPLQLLVALMLPTTLCVCLLRAVSSRAPQAPLAAACHVKGGLPPNRAVHCLPLAQLLIIDVAISLAFVLAPYALS